MAKEFYLLSTDDLHQVSGYVHDHFDDTSKPLKVVVKNYGKRSLSQNALMHVIFTEISDYLINKGRTDWTPEFTKEQLKNKFLGWEDKEFVDVKTGEKTTRSVLVKTSTLDKGDAYQFTTEILDWAESIGCQIKIPANCEYMELRREQSE